MLVAIFSVVAGILAIANARALGNHRVFGDLRSWEWTVLIPGAIQIVGIGHTDQDGRASLAVVRRASRSRTGQQRCGGQGRSGMTVP